MYPSSFGKISKIRSELDSPIRNDQYLINIQLGIIFIHVGSFHKHRMCTLSHPFNNDLNGILQFPGPGQTNHKIHINSLPFSCCNLNRLGKTPMLKVFGLNLLAIRALLHKLREISLHTFLPIDLLEIMIDFGRT